ncbi:hypothetical protein EDC04DRAFT_3091208 [Pisolithus marmoratus]|nr:hypothetical protein EDC04DRAFT_3091208 [Pisolithus marmoratus]
MSTPVEGGFEGLYDTVHQTRLTNYVTLSCPLECASIVDDARVLTKYFLRIPLIWRYYPKTSNDEHISWRGRGRRILVQTLFVFGRYYALLYLVLVASGGELLYSTLVNVILMIRLNAMYQVFHGTEGLRKHKVFLASAVIIEFLVEFSVCIVIATWTEKREIEPLAGIPGPGCVISEYPNTVLTLPAWIIAILVATIFLAVTLRLLYSSTKSKFKCFADFTLSNIREEIRNIQPITRVLVKDSVLFFLPMFGILVTSIPVVAVDHKDPTNVTVPPVLFLCKFHPKYANFMNQLLDDDQASRLIIHIRESFARSSQGGSDREVESINFASRSLVVSHTGTHV